MRKKVDNALDMANDMLQKYLNEHGMRKTEERVAILRQVSSYAHHFDVETLFIDLRDNKFRVSRATLYNTLELLKEIGLVTKYNFGDSVSDYEFVNPVKMQIHYHLIDSDTKRVVEFEDKRIDRIKKELEIKYGMVIDTCQLVFYGHKKGKK